MTKALHNQGSDLPFDRNTIDLVDSASKLTSFQREAPLADYQSQGPLLNPNTLDQQQMSTHSMTSPAFTAQHNSQNFPKLHNSGGPQIPSGRVRGQLEALGYAPGDRVYIRLLAPKKLPIEEQLRLGLAWEPEPGKQVPVPINGYLTLTEDGASFTRLKKRREGEQAILGADGKPVWDISAQYEDGYAQLRRWNDRGYGVYLVVNPGGVDDDDIVEARALFYECDALSKEDQWKRLRALEFILGAKATLVIETRNSLHVYFTLTEPEFDLSDWTRYQQRLIQGQNSDRAIWNPSRLMRLADYDHKQWNGETIESFPVSIVQQSDTEFDLSDFDDVLPEWDKSIWEKDEPTGHTASLGEYSIANFAQYLTGYNANGRQGWITCQCPTHTKDGEGHSLDSLHINVATGKFKCHHGCDTKQIYADAKAAAIAGGFDPFKQECDRVERQVELDEAEDREHFIQSIRWALRQLKKPERRQRRKRVRSINADKEIIPYKPGRLPDWHQGNLPLKPYRLNNPEQRAQFWAEASRKGYHILDAGAAGSGKSYAAGELSNSQFSWKLHGFDEDGKWGVREIVTPKLLYFDQNHRNPSTAPIESNYADLPTRHGGLTIDDSRQTPGGKNYLLVPKPSDPPGVNRTQDNCTFWKEFIIAHEKGVKWAGDEASINPICRSCEHFAMCGSEKAINYKGMGFRAERYKVLNSADKIRLHPDSAPGGEFEYGKAIGIWEESGALIQPTTKVEISWEEALAQWDRLESELPDLYDEIRPLKNVLRELQNRDNQANRGYYGLNHTETLTLLLERSGLDLKIFSDDLLNLVEEVTETRIDEIWDFSVTRADNDTLTRKCAGIRSKIKRRRNKLALLQAKLARTPAFFNEAIDLARDISELEVEIDKLRTELRDAIDQRDVNKRDAKNKTNTNRAAATAALIDMPIQWLDKFLRVLAGNTQGAIRIAPDGKLIVSSINPHLQSVIQSIRTNVFLDATGNREALAMDTGIDLSRIIEIHSPEVDDTIKRYQILGFGLAGKGRAESTDERINAAIAQLRDPDKKSAVLDHLAKRDRTEADGHHGADSRGQNRWQDVDQFFIIGTPHKNVGDLYDRWLTMGGESLGLSFDEYYQWQTDAELIQEDARTRGYRRPGEPIEHFYFTDAPLPFDVEQIEAADITIEAASRGMQKRYQAVEAFFNILEQKGKVTQATIADMVGRAQSRISQIFKDLGGWDGWKKIISSLKYWSFRKTDISLSDKNGLTEDELQIAQEWLPTLFSDDISPEEAAELATETVASVGWISWNRIVGAATLDTRLKLLSVFTQFSAPPDAFESMRC